jgi:hypothetical protein
MEYYPFPALLRTSYSPARVVGSAGLCHRQNAINFSGEFIPLLPLGSPAAIRWIHGQETVATFEGNVYLSSQTLLRLVNISPELMADARSTFAVNTRLPAGIKTGRGGECQPTAAEVLYLSTDFITLKTAQPMPKGQNLFLDCEVDFLTLRNLELTVRQHLTLRRTESLIFCGVLRGGDDNLIALSAYSARLAQLNPA